MILRAALISLFAVCLLCFPAMASRPAGLAGNLVIDLGDRDGGFLPGQCERRSFEWLESAGPRQLEPADTLKLEMAIVPFQSGITFVGLDTVEDQTFFGIEFSDGLIHGLPYKRGAWNDVVVELHPATQDYVITVNGLQAGPFAFADFCQDLGGCFSVELLRIHGYSNEIGSAAWIDTISVFRESAAGGEILGGISFDSCSYRPDVVGGVVLVATPPERFLPRGRCDRR